MYGGLNCFKKIKGKANEIRSKESLFRVLRMAKGKLVCVYGVCAVVVDILQLYDLEVVRGEGVQAIQITTELCT